MMRAPSKSSVKTKPAKTKEPVKKDSGHDEEESDLDTDVASPKQPKAVIDTAEPIDDLGGDLKLDDDSPVLPEEEDENADEMTLDDEELNPFGDKWEM